MDEESSVAGSPLSSLDSDSGEYDDLEHEIMDHSSTRPPKRQKTGETSSLRATPISHQNDVDLGYISSDSEGDVPLDIIVQRPEDDDPVHEQVTVCQWVGCDAGDQGNMDKLVDHIHNEHIETRLRKYTCEWSDCTRRSMAHASGYALKAHVRSHTREKPFYCVVPECDRAFTRSDALAKHMRTVHETEALRPSDPIPKSMQPVYKTKLKLIIKTPQSAAQSPAAEQAVNGSTGSDTARFVPELGFSAEEEEMDLERLWRLLRNQVQWAEEDAEALKREVESMEEIRRREWMQKELLLHQVIKSEKDWLQRRKEAIAEMGEVMSVEEIRAQASEQVKQKHAHEDDAMDTLSVPEATTA